MSITVIGFFRTRSEAEEAVQQLTGAGFYRNDIDLSHSRLNTPGSSGYSDSDYQSVDSRADEVRTVNDRTEARRTVDARTDYRDNPETVYQTNEEYINRDRSDSDNDASAHEYREKREHRGNAITRFFDSLFGDGSDDSKKYSNASARADSIVTVHAGSREQAEEAANILDGCGAMDIDEGELVGQTYRDAIVENPNAASGYQDAKDGNENESAFGGGRNRRDASLTDEGYMEEDKINYDSNTGYAGASDRRFQPEGTNNYDKNTGDAALTEERRVREEDRIHADRARRDAELKEMQLREEERINSEKERLEAEFKEKQLREQERFNNERERLEAEFQKKQRKEQERIDNERERLEAEFQEKQRKEQERIDQERERREAELEEKRLREEERIDKDKRSEKVVISETVDLTNEGLTDEDLKEAGLSVEEIRAIRNAGDNDSYQTSGRETKIVYQEEMPAGQRSDVAGSQRRRSRIIDTRVDEDVRLREEHDRIHRRG